MSENASQPARAFGFTLANVDLLLDPQADVQYVADATVYPLFLAPRRVLGLIQVRGQPVPVLDARPGARGLARRTDRVQVLVVAGGFDAGALCVEKAPHPVEIANTEDALVGRATDETAGFAATPADAMTVATVASATPRPDCVFADALREDLVDIQGRRWWRFDAPSLFRALALD